MAGFVGLAGFLLFHQTGLLVLNLIIQLEPEMENLVANATSTQETTTLTSYQTLACFVLPTTIVASEKKMPWPLLAIKLRCTLSRIATVLQSAHFLALQMLATVDV